MLLAWLTDTVTNDLDRALHYTLLWGLDGIEVRTVGGPSDRVPNINEAKLKRRLAEQDVPVVAVVPGLFEGAEKDRSAWLNDIALFEETLSFCRRVGCSRVVVSAFAGPVDGAGAEEALRRAGAAAARRGVALAVLNETGMAHETGASLAALLASVDHPSVRAAWDPAAAARAGEDPSAGLHALAGRVDLVRCGNVRRDGDAWEPAPLVEGVVDWPDQLRALRGHGFDGPLSLTVTLRPAPLHGLRMATDLIRMLRAVQAG